MPFKLFCVVVQPYHVQNRSEIVISNEIYVQKFASDDETGDLRGLDTMTLEKILITSSRHRLSTADIGMDQSSAVDFSGH